MLRRVAIPWVVSAVVVLGALLLLRHDGIENASARAVRPCAHPELPGAGEAVAPLRLGAIDMLSARAGVAVTLARVDCARRIRGGEEIGLVADAVRLAVTRDGGAHWRTEGTPQPLDHPAFPQGFGYEQLAAASPRRAWLLASDGVPFATSDGGAHWTRLAIPVPAVSLALTAHSVWVLSCPGHTRRQGLSCTPALRRIDRANGRITAQGLSREGRTFQPSMFAPGDRVLVIDEATGVGPHPLLVSTDGGRRWARRSLPRWQRRPCAFPSSLTVLNRRDWWFICIGGAAAGSSAKALFETSDAGRSWTLRSAVGNLLGPFARNGITVAEPAALTAASAGRLWLATYDGLGVSDTAGRTWRTVPGINQQGAQSIIDALSARRAWLLAPGAGLWRTTDGERWVRLGSRGPG